MGVLLESLFMPSLLVLERIKDSSKIEPGTGGVHYKTNLFPSTSLLSPDRGMGIPLGSVSAVTWEDQIIGCEESPWYLLNVSHQ